jgi:hypothetical protein
MEEKKETEQPVESASHSNETNTLAIVGFIFAFFMPLVGFILTIIAIGQIKKNQQEGKGLAVAGLVISSAWMAVLLIWLSMIAIGIGAIATFLPKWDTDLERSSIIHDQVPVSAMNTPVTDGSFEITVQSFKCGETKVGTISPLTKQALGQYCLLNLTVKNIGSEAQSFLPTNQYLYNAAGQQYSADSMATIYAVPSGENRSWYDNINPGVSATGVIVFDIPKDVTPTQANMHESAFSTGVTVEVK